MPAPKSANGSSFPNRYPKPTGPFNPFINPAPLNPFPAPTDIIYDAVLEPVNPIRLSFSPNGRSSGRLR
jgi:hypothetical protein